MFQKNNQGNLKKEIPKRFGLQKKFRLTEPKTFRKLFASEEKWPHPFFILRFSKSTNFHSRLGMIVGKNKIRMAVDRNCVKRMTREVYRYYRQSLPKGDYLVHFNRGVPRNRLPELREALEAGFSHLAERRDKVDLKRLEK